MKKKPNEAPVSVLVAGNEQALADASIKLHRALFEVKTFFPDMATDRLLLITGAIVHAASSAIPTRVKKVVVLGEPWDVSDATVKSSKSPAASKVKKTRAIKEEAPTPFRLAVLRVLGTQTLTMEEITTAIVERGWFPKTASTKPRSYINSMMANNKKYFVNVSPGVYRARKAALKEAGATAPAPKEKPKGTSSKSEPTFNRDDALRHLVGHGEPITAKDLASAIGAPEARSLTPLLVGLRDFGAVKKKDGADGKGVWEPVAGKIQQWDSERNGGSAFHLNGAATP